MKVLQLIKSRHFAGSEQAVVTLSRELQHRGHAVVVGVKRGGMLAERLRGEGLAVLEIPALAWMLPYWLKRWIRKNGVELVHSHLSGAARLAEKAVRSSKVGLVVHLHILRDDPVFLAACARGYLIGNSDFTTQWHLEKLKLPPDRVVTILNSNQLPKHILSQEDKYKLRARLAQELGLKVDQPLILLPGRVSPGKSQHILIEAMPTILAAQPRARLLVVGDLSKKAKYVQRLTRRCEELGLKEAVVFTGFRRDVADFMQAADLVVIPSMAEPFGLVVIETMMAGTPVIAANAGGIPEILEGGQWGTPMDSREGNEWAAAVLAFFAQPEDAQTKAKAAQLSAFERFNPSKMTDQVEAVYRRALARR